MPDEKAITGSATRQRRLSRTDSILLDGVPMDMRTSTFADGPWARLATRATARELPAGDWLFRAGDPAGSMYVVLSGRLEVLSDADESTVIRVLGRGDAVGELALLTESPRSASVRARRDTNLMEVSREDFTEFLDQRPEFAISLARVLAAQLQTSRGVSMTMEALPTTISIVAANRELDPREFGDRLVGALGTLGTVAELDEPPDVQERGLGAVLDRSERSRDRVVLIGGRPDDDLAWTRFVLRSGDRVVVLADSRRPARAIAADTRLQGCDLVFLAGSSAAPGLGAWVDALAPRATHVLRGISSDDAGIERLARRLAGRSVGVVLSGGGARGFAHIGVLEELLAAGIEIDRVGGCSMGSFIGANFALGRSPAEIRERCHEEFVQRNPMNDYTVPLVALLRSRKGNAMLERTFGSARIEELSREYFCVSCDLLSSELVVHRSGSVKLATRASMTLPAIFPPVPFDAQLLVDGGVLNNLPVEVMATSGEGPVVAVDVTARFDVSVHAPRPGRNGATSRLRRHARGLVTGSDVPLPGLVETLIRCMLLGSIDTDAAAREYAELVIVPRTGDLGLTAWHRLDDMYAVGREAARAELADAPACLFP